MSRQQIVNYPFSNISGLKVSWASKEYKVTASGSLNALILGFTDRL